MRCPACDFGQVESHKTDGQLVFQCGRCGYSAQDKLVFAEELGPIVPKCSTCGGDGWIWVDGRKQLCSTCGGFESDLDVKDEDFLGSEKKAAVDCQTALKDLLDFVVSGRRYETQNPYTIPEVNAAYEALGIDWRTAATGRCSFPNCKRQATHKLPSGKGYCDQDWQKVEARR